VIVPTLRLPWYDAGRDRLASVAIPGQALDVFDPRWRLAWQLVAGVTGALLLIVAGWMLYRMVRWRLARRRSLRAIRAAADARELAHAVRRFSLTGQPEAPSLGAWQRQMRQETGRCADDRLVAALQARRYGRASSAEADARADWVRALSRARPASVKRSQRRAQT